MPKTFQLLTSASLTRTAYVSIRQTLISLGLTLALFFTCAGAVWAQGPAASQPKWALEIDRIETLAGVSMALTLQQVLDGQAGPFNAQTSAYLADPSWEKALWVKVYLRPAARLIETHDFGNALELGKPFIDDVSLFTLQLTPLGWQWLQQDTGLRHPIRADTAISHLPFFGLLSSAELASQPVNQRFVVLRINHRFPLSVPVSVKAFGQIVAESYVSTALLAMTLGVIALVCLMTAALALLQRDPAYAWYALYAAASWFFCAGFLGFSHQVIWPSGGHWPNTSIPLFLLLAMAAKLQFCRWIFLPPDQQPGLQRASMLLGAVSALFCAGYSLQESHWNAWTLVCLVLIGACLVLILFLGAWGLLHNREASRVWVLAFAPVALVVIYRLLEAVGWAHEQFFSFNTGVYALGIEVTIMGVALLWFARNRQSVKERRLALDRTDPMTGFSDARGFQNDLTQAWQDAKLTQTEVSVAYISLLDRLRNERTMRRIVRILRTVAQEGDSVARLDDGTMAILLVNQGMGEGLSHRLSRIVALGLMPDTSDKSAPVLHFRIGATSSAHYTSDISILGADLRRFMADNEHWQGKTIRFLTLRRPRGKPSFRSSDSFAEFWDQAMDTAVQTRLTK